MNGVFEHLAIVENPRYERAFVAVNAYIASNEDNFTEQDHPRDENGKFTDDKKSIISDWGTEYKEYSGKPKEAIEHLLTTKTGYVPAAITKDGIGNIDFVYGKTGAKGYGLAHIIEQRNAQRIDGMELVRSLPSLIEKGTVITKDNHIDRKYIISDNNEIAIRLDYNGESRNWVVSAYIKNELQGSNSLENWHTMLAHDSNLSVVNGYVSITTPVTNIITHNSQDFNSTNNKLQPKAYNSIDINPIIQYIQNYKGETMDEETKSVFGKLIDALKARNEADEKEKECKNADEDKRKLIDELTKLLKTYFTSGK